MLVVSRLGARQYGLLKIAKRLCGIAGRRPRLAKGEDEKTGALSLLLTEMPGCDVQSIAHRASEMTEIKSETTEMSSAVFAQMALRDRVAPPSIGSVKQRITVAARKLGWKVSRAKDVWYADPRISIDADEMRAIERLSGLVYAAQQEVRTNEELIAKIDAFMVGHDADFYGAFRTAVRSFFGLPDRSGTAGDR